MKRARPARWVGQCVAEMNSDARSDPAKNQQRSHPGDRWAAAHWSAAARFAPIGAHRQKPTTATSSWHTQAGFAQRPQRANAHHVRWRQYPVGTACQELLHGAIATCLREITLYNQVRIGDHTALTQRRQIAGQSIGSGDHVLRTGDGRPPARAPAAADGSRLRAPRRCCRHPRSWPAYRSDDGPPA